MNAPTPLTPSQTVGPFFHDALIVEGSSVLADEQARGEHIRIVGHVLDGDGEPVDDAMVEIWQPDASGVFAHPSDPNADRVDPHFRGFGRSDTVDGGRFSFETVKPGIVQAGEVPLGHTSLGHAPFVNVRVFARGLLHHLVTRIYFSDEANDADPVLAAIDPARRATLVARRDEVSGVVTYHFDVRLQGENETVFFDE